MTHEAMTHETRRAFMTGSLALAGAAALAPASLGGALGLPRRPRTGADVEGFLRAVVAGDLAAVRRMLGEDPTLAGAADPAGRSAFALALLHGGAREHGGYGEHGRNEIAEAIRGAGYAPDLHESALALDWTRFDELAEPDPLAVNRDHPIGGSAMVTAAPGGAGREIWRVYRYCGDPNARSRGAAGPSAVRAALDHADLPTAEVTAATLLSNAADPNQPEPEGRSALHVAAGRGSAEMVEMLVRWGANPSARDEQGRTPLALAERAGHAGVVAMLRAHEAIPRVHSTSRRAYDVDGKPYRPPDFAGLPLLERRTVVGAAHGNLETVRAEVARDARLAHGVATTDEGAVEAGAHMGNRPIVEFLLKHGAPYSLPTAVMRGDSDRVRALLREDPRRIQERGAHGFALLWYPVIGGGLVELAEILLEAGATVDDQHHLGTTALHWAAMRGQADMVALLIEHGADVNRVGRKFDAAGETPLDMADGRHEKVAELLRARGARKKS